jgi:hypothetical protein
VYYGEYCILREDTVRERRGSYSGCVVGCIPSFLWIIKRKELEIYMVKMVKIRKNMLREMEDKIVKKRKNLKASQDRKKCCVDKGRTHKEYKVGDHFS